jgi:flavin reductase (DIM6/NTAB) family NADH-FMN oxidoreductase RutF
VTEDGDLDRLTGQLSYPMLIVTASGRSGRAGCLVGFHTQCSIDPPRFLVCISRKNHTSRVAATVDVLGVHFLDASHYELSVLFGERTGDHVDKFAECPWEDRGGVPILTEVGASFSGLVLQRIELGDHTGYLLEPVAASVRGELRQLSFQQVKNLRPGHP